MPLVRLVYISTIDTERYTNDEVVQILKSSRQNNQSAHITGLLIFDKQFFMQCLEGERAATSELYLKIAADQRHKDVHLVSCEDIDVRMFEDWSMGFVADVSKNREIVSMCCPGAFNPYNMSAKDCLNMIHCYAKNRDFS